MNSNISVRNSVPFAHYDAFTETAFGGSQAAIVINAANIGQKEREQIAREIGYPATAFVNQIGDDWVDVQFRSTVTELPMCGHGTICLMTQLSELGFIDWDKKSIKSITLRLTSGTANVDLFSRTDGRIEVMLDITPLTFTTPTPDSNTLADILGIQTQNFRQDCPIEIADGDFIHLIVPIKDLASVEIIRPDFDHITQYCHEHSIETIAVFCSEVNDPQSTIHVRDFCPAVGVSESAAAGTTNAALTCYLIRHSLVLPDADGQISVNAEQGHEIKRPSKIKSRVTMNGDTISRLQVGGVATKVAEGELLL